jgi:hypothetical protein
MCRRVVDVEQDGVELHVRRYRIKTGAGEFKEIALPHLASAIAGEQRPERDESLLVPVDDPLE